MDPDKPVEEKAFPLRVSLLSDSKFTGCCFSTAKQSIDKRTGECDLQAKGSCGGVGGSFALPCKFSVSLLCREVEAKIP